MPSIGLVSTSPRLIAQRKKASQHGKDITPIGNLSTWHPVEDGDNICARDLGKGLCPQDRHNVNAKRALDQNSPTLADAGLFEAVSIIVESQIDRLAATLR